ncbi:MAG: TIGR03936 family radical SAM-associated protein [Acidimicrobiales bacterium]
MKLRVRFTKNGRIRFISHRDVARVFERALRIAGASIAYSEGFSPRPKISFGLALSVGFESDAEYLDVDLAAPVDLEEFPKALTAALPDGLAVDAVAPLVPGTESLQQAIVCCEWKLEAIGLGEAAMALSVSQLLDRNEIMLERNRKGKRTVVDVRPAVLSLKVAGPTDDGVGLAASLSTEQVTVRPDELVPLLAPGVELGRARRLKQWINVDGQQHEPLAAAVACGRNSYVRDLGPTRLTEAQNATAGSKT